VNTTKALSPRFGLKGRVQVSVLSPRGDRHYPAKPNLILDQGLNQIADTLICNIFSVAVKGIGIAGVTTDTTENVDNANSYTMNNGDNTITRVAGTRDFTSDDVGSLVRFDGTGFETRIQSINSVSSVEADPSPDHNETAQDIHLYFVQQVELEGEIGRTSDYSAGTGDNSTTTVDEVRTFKRTFIFPEENTLVETPEFTNFYSQTGTTVTRTAGGRNFVVGDIGKTIRYRNTELEVEIQSITDVDEVEVTPALTAGEQNIDILETILLKEIPSFTNTYSRAGTTVTRDAGTRDFTDADVGKVIYFTTAAVESKIVSKTSSTVVEVEDSGVISTQAIALYEYTEYSEIGFSHSDETSDNLNIRVKLASPVKVLGATALLPSEQLKVTYELDLTVAPSTEQTGTLNGVIIDSGNDMSANKNGKFAIESYATSIIGASGETDDTFGLAGTFRTWLPGTIQGHRRNRSARHP
jgi:hypothetical protein